MGRVQETARSPSSSRNITVAERWRKPIVHNHNPTGQRRAARGSVQKTLRDQVNPRWTFHVTVSQGYSCVNCRKFFHPFDEKTARPSKFVLALKFGEFQQLMARVEELIAMKPKLSIYRAIFFHKSISNIYIRIGTDLIVVDHRRNQWLSV